MLLALCTLTLALQPKPTQPGLGFQHQALGRLRGPLSLTASADHTPGYVSKQWSRYLDALEKKPMKTKMLTSAFLAGTGDIIAQAIESAGPFALRRFFTLIAVQVLYIVPILTAFYAANERLTGRLKMKDGWGKTGVALAFDQLINAPIVVAGFFCAFQLATAISDTIATGAPFALGVVYQACARQLRSSYLSTVVTNWKVWVLPQLFNFAVVPPYGRVAFANLVGLVWSVILSVIANGSK